MQDCFEDTLIHRVYSLTQISSEILRDCQKIQKQEILVTDIA